ncbi:MAG: AI-2E family transporter [Bacillota bacterium]|nr:AI-2E family transporter [Bacillota bacterium]
MQIDEGGRVRTAAADRIKKWLIRIAILAAAVVAAIIFKDLLAFLAMPLITALVLTYFGLPLVRRFEKKLGRQASIFLYLGMIVSIVAAVALIAGPAAVAEWSSFSKELPNLKVSLGQLIKTITGAHALTDFVAQLPEKISSIFENAVNSILANMDHTLQTVANLLLGLLFMLLVLKDREYIANSALFMLPGKARTSTLAVCSRIRKEIDKFLKGQLIIAVISGTIATAGFYIAGLRFALLLGLFAAVLGFIPLIGPVLGAIPAILVGLVQGGPVLLYCGIVIIIQQIVLGVAGPSVFSRSLNIHPLYAFIALAAGGYLGGILGFLLAVPVLIIIKSTVSEIFNIYLKRKNA